MEILDFKPSQKTKEKSLEWALSNYKFYFNYFKALHPNFEEFQLSQLALKACEIKQKYDS